MCWVADTGGLCKLRYLKPSFWSCTMQDPCFSHPLTWSLIVNLKHSLRHSHVTKCRNTIPVIAYVLKMRTIKHKECLRSITLHIQWIICQDACLGCGSLDSLLDYLYKACMNLHVIDIHHPPCNLMQYNTRVDIHRRHLMCQTKLSHHPMEEVMLNCMPQCQRHMSKLYMCIMGTNRWNSC